MKSAFIIWQMQYLWLLWSHFDFFKIILLFFSQINCLPFLIKPYMGFGYCARAQLISQHVDAGELNILPQQWPIILSLTKVMLN